MESFFTDYLALLEEHHENILEALNGLPSEALDWIPGKDMNSLAVLVTHLTGAERYWIGDIAAQDPSHRDRDAEFRVHDLGLEVLKKRLADNLDHARNVLNHFTTQDLEIRRDTSGGRNVTVAWALLHALEHTTLHLGQIQMTRQLWEQANSSD